MTHMKKEGVTKFQFGEGKNGLSMTREKETVYMSGPSDGRSPYPANAGMDQNFTSPSAEEKEEAVPAGFVVTSPVVGVFYDSPAPDQEPYVTLGSYVKKGDVLCIIEAMKLMNEVNSPVSGQVKEILVKKASRVEYGHKLFVIDPGHAEEADHD
jgi:acetyl-CoA carboxylase biotin carboxyl carrier protein